MTNKTISRRQALKTLLAAAGGIGASAFLPSRWVKPVVQSGVLPVHAQASASYMLDNDGFDRILAYIPEPTVATGVKHLASPVRKGGNGVNGVKIKLDSWNIDADTTIGGNWNAKKGHWVITQIEGGYNGWAYFYLDSPSNTHPGDTLHYVAQNGEFLDVPLAS